MTGPYRFHTPHVHLARAFGNDWFSLKAEAFARFFGTPGFLIGQTAIVVAWIVANATGMVRFDLYPFILLNLAFSLQAAYAAPLILLAQTRQADRDTAHSEADAQHREAIAVANAERQAEVAAQTALLVTLMQQNTELTASSKMLSERINTLTEDVHRQVMQTASSPVKDPGALP